MRLFVLLLFFPVLLFSQKYPAIKPLFHDSVVSEARVLIHPDSLDELLQNLENEYEYHTTFIFNNPLCNTDTFADAGFRLRGGTSLVSEKKSFKVSLNTYAPARKYHGVEKLNFNGEHNDPCIMRSRLCWDICRDFGLPASRSAYTALYINTEFRGLYMNVEHIDEEFVDTRFGNKNGNLYKCLWPADLTYLGSNPDLYKFMVGDRRAYELHTNTLMDNYTDLAFFIDILNNVPDDSLLIRLPAVFNVQSYLKYLAIEAITGHWDAYSYNKNNFYLYFNTDKNKFEFIPYDMDNTFGIDWMGEDWGTRDIYNWAADEPRPLTKRILANPLWRKEYSFYVNQLIHEVFTYAKLNEKIDYLYTLIYPFAALDPYRPLDYGWTMTQFNTSFTQNLSGHVKYGLKPYITARIASAEIQLVLPQVPQIRINEFQATNTVTIADEHGEFDDWIELYNAGNVAVNLGELCLTDNLNIPDKWYLPQQMLNPGAYLLIWADGTPLQGSLHSNFKLEANGESIGVFTRPDLGSNPVDILLYGDQKKDTTYGLIPNGQGLCHELNNPTPGYSNTQNSAIGDITLNKNNLLVFPNPGKDVVWVTLPDPFSNTVPEGCFITLRDIQGSLIRRIPVENPGKSIQLSIRSLQPGLYILECQNNTARIAGCKLIVQ